MVSASGNEQLATPSSTAHSHGAAAGAAHSPAYPARPTTPITTAIPLWLDSRPATAASAKDSGTPSSEVTANSRPAVCAGSPASRKTCGSQPMIT